MKSQLILSSVVAVFLLVLAPMSAPQAQNSSVQPAAGEDMTGAINVRHWVDRTALFAGDRVNYYLEISCARDVDILLDFPTNLQRAAWNFAERACQEHRLEADIMPLAWCQDDFLDHIRPDLVPLS